MNFDKIYNIYKEVGDIHKDIKDELIDYDLKGKTSKQIIEYIEGRIKDETQKKGLKTFNNGIAFPVGVSVNHCCAHYTYSPQYSDITIGNNDLVKIDFGINNMGFIVDSALTISTNKDNDHHKKLMKASKEALKNAIKNLRPGALLGEIGKETQEIIESYDLNPVKELCGHKILPFKIHADKFIPNIAMNLYPFRVETDEIYAVEPFVSDKSGITYEDKNNISHFCLNYQYDSKKREKLIYNCNQSSQDLYYQINNKCRTLPFCDNWLTGDNIIQDLQDLHKYNIVNIYPPIYEVDSNALVSQFEHTVLVRENKTEILT